MNSHSISRSLASVSAFAGAGLLAGLFLAPLHAGAEAENRLSLSLPVKCTVGKDCWIQNLVDFDATNGWRDPYCGSASFDRHKGTDFRVRTLKDLEKKIPVFAMADGKVVALRNTMEERLVENDADIARVHNKECGNGLFIEHGNGWSTQTCHLAKGSVRLKKGDKVKRGDVIGTMGLSGHTTFPHVHVTVRKGKAIIEPMTGLAQTDTCSRTPGFGAKTLWNAAAQKQIGVVEMSALLDAGFVSASPSSAKLLKGNVTAAKGDGPLIFYANFINLRKGDRIDLVINGPNGIYAASKGDPLAGPKANWTQYTGKRGALPAGSRYRGTATLYRDGKPLITRDTIEVGF